MRQTFTEHQSTLQVGWIRPHIGHPGDLQFLNSCARDNNNSVAIAAEENLTLVVKHFANAHLERVRFTLLWGIAKVRATAALRLLVHILPRTTPSAMTGVLGTMVPELANMLQVSPSTHVCAHLYGSRGYTV